MNQDRHKIKSEIIKDMQSLLHNVSNFNINESIELFITIIEKENLKEIDDAIQIRYIDQDFKKFETARTLLAGQFETFVKTVFNIISKNVRGELKVCLVEFFKDFNLLSSKDSYCFFEKDDTTKISSYSPDFFTNKMTFGKELKLSYDLRNAIIHNGKLYTGQEPGMDSLPYDIKSFIISMLFFVSKYSERLNNVYDKQKEIFLNTYLSSVIDEFKKWRSRFVHITGKEDFKVLDTFAIEQKTDNNDGKAERNGTIDYLRNNEIDEKRMIIWADAGMGKSTTLQYLAYKDAYEILHNKKELPIPVYIPLKLQTDRNISIENTIYSVLGVDDELGHVLLLSGRITLFLDGVNEILKDLREQKRREIENIIKTYPDIFIIISNRPQLYNEFNKVPVFQLLKMDEKQIKLFLEKNTDDEKIRKKILDNVQKNKSLEKMISTPLMLWMLINVVEERGDIPERKTIMIEEFMHRLYKREALKDTDFNIDEIDSLLRYLGAESYNLNDSNAGMNRTQVEKILLKRKNEYGFSTSITYFLDTVTKLNILAKDGKQFSFAHQEYQTYFAGEELDISDFLDLE